MPGGRKPADVIVIGRGTRWGNRHPVGKPCPVESCGGVVHDRASAVEAFTADLAADPVLLARARVELAGKTLWCPGCPTGTGPCHGDVLLAAIQAAEPEVTP